MHPSIEGLPSSFARCNFAASLFATVKWEAPSFADKMRGYARHVQRVLVATLVLNLSVAVGKIVAGYRANSLSVIGDGLHSSVDALSNVIALIVIRFSTAPPDEDHPFGHSRYETLAAFVLGGLLFLTAVELARSAVTRLFAPQDTLADALTIGTILATLAINIFVSWYERREGQRHQSEVLIADAAHTRSDVYVTMAVLGGLVLSRFGFEQADSILALFVAGAIAFAGWRVYRDVLPALTDRAVFHADEVAAIVRGVPGVVSVHDIRSRGTRREPYVQMHLVVDRHDVVGAHEVADEVERRLAAGLGVKESFVHIEPEDDRSGPPGSAPKG